LILGLGTGTGSTGAEQTAQQTSSLEGIVVDAMTKLPVSNVRVQMSPGPRVTMSDGNGRFSFENIASDSCLIETKRVGYMAVRMMEHKLPGNSGIPIVLTPGQRIQSTIYLSPAPVVTGRVVDSQGLPMEGVRVIPYRSAFDNSGVQAPKYFSAILTNDLGVYRSTDLDPGEYFLKFEVPTFQKTTSPAPLFYSIYYPGTLEERKAVLISLESGVENHLNDISLPSAPGGALRIQIVNEIGAVEKGTALMYLRRKNESVFPQTISVSLPAKFMEVGRLAPGQYDVEVYFPMSTAKGRASFDVQDRDVNIDVRLQKRVDVSGTVSLLSSAGPEGTVQKSRPISGVQVHFEDTSALRNISPILASGVDGTLSGGNLSLGIFPGLYRLQVTNIPTGMYVAGIRAGNQDALRDDFEARGGQQTIEVIVEENPILVQGVVTDTSAHPLAKAVVALIPDDRKQKIRFASTATDAFGSFRIQAAPGKYRIYSWVELDGMAFRNSDFMKTFDERGQTVLLKSNEHSPILSLQVLDQ
jgi:hypothetical protein